MYHPMYHPVIGKLNNLRNEVMGSRLSATKKSSISNAIQNIEAELLSYVQGISPNPGVRHYQQQTPFPNPKMEPCPTSNTYCGHNPLPTWGYSMGPERPNPLGPVGVNQMTPTGGMLPMPPMSPNTGGNNVGTFASIPPMRPQEPIQIPMPGIQRYHIRNVVVDYGAVEASLEIHKSKLKSMTKEDEERVCHDVLKIIGSRDGMANFDNQYRDEIVTNQATTNTTLFYLFTKIVAINTVMILVTNRYGIDGFSSNTAELNFELSELCRIFHNTEPKTNE